MVHRIAISSAHSRFVRGATGFIDEVDESRRVVERVAAIIRSAGVTCHVFHDDVSRSVSGNIAAIVAWHQGLGAARDRDISVHFNAFSTATANGTEVLYRSSATLAGAISGAMARAGGFVNRGAKLRTNLGFLNQLTAKPACLLEVCFVTNRRDSLELYQPNFEAICRSIAESAADVRLGAAGPPTAPGPAPAPPPAGTPAPARPTLRQGDRNDHVRIVQRALGATADGIFGPITAGHVRTFQASQRLTVDAIVGPLTWGALERVHGPL